VFLRLVWACVCVVVWPVYAAALLACASVPVGGIPGAYGFTLGQEICYVMFSDGRFQFAVGAGGSPSAAKRPTKPRVIAAAQILYGRVHGR
jgi:hypothetical protein